MENPTREIESVIRTLTQGTPDQQHDAIYRYFAPGATFEHPFCRVPTFQKLNVPGLGEYDSRALIAAIFRWYKIMSPKIDIEIESCAHDESTNILYITIFQIFSIWFIPFYRAPVRLTTVLHLTPASTTTSSSSPSSSASRDSSSPPPYDAAHEKRRAVQKGDEPSYAAVIAGEAEASSSSGSKEAAAAGPSSSASSSTAAESTNTNENRPRRYLIATQQDLYQTTEFVKFVGLAPGSVVLNVLQLVATLFCLVGAVLLGPVVGAVWGGKGGRGEGKKRV
ncbi:uncharacterized protein C8A04DRAFT_25351 [Dichotomopilus funicola]|uniref:SigF-like NTF2-like domain-containing protein n=1 Tax=Dichotomopilus funicola TaxID=1934379 RepID=A0AAN6ZQP9_9PEZI|nr:hypothetical protein C8A04DRAFT_25351 [Dichotomopilus funicola]